MLRHLFKEHLYTIGVIAVHILFFAIALSLGKIYNGDSLEYVWEGLNIKDRFFFYSGNPAFDISDEFKTLRTPVYPLYLAGIYSISINNFLAIAVQGIVSIFNLLYLRRILLDMGFDKRYDGWLLLFVALYPVQFVYANIIAPDIFLQTFTLIYFRHAIRLLKTRDIKDAWWMSMALILGLLVKPVLYPYTVFHAILLLLFPGKRYRLRSLPVLLMPVICILIYSGWNQSRTGKFHFTSTQSFNAIYYYSKYFESKGNNQSGIEFVEAERKKMYAQKDFSAQYDYTNSRAKELLKQEFFPYMLFHFRNSLRFFFDPGKGELDMFLGNLELTKLYSGQTKGIRAYWMEEGFQGVLKYIRQQPSSLVSIIVALLCAVKMLGVVLFLFSKRYNIQSRGFVFFLLAYFAGITGPISAAHYVLPISLLISGLAILGYLSYLQQRRNKTIITS